MNNIVIQPVVSKSTVILRGIRGRCPKCGQGKLFQAYLKQSRACTACGEDYTALRADDGPTWLTVIVTGHISVPVSIYLAMNSALAKVQALTLLLLFTIGFALFLLPRAKGVFIGMMWLHKQKQPVGDGKYAGLAKLP